MCRAFPCAATRLRGIENCDRRLIFGADYIPRENDDGEYRISCASPEHAQDPTLWVYFRGRDFVRLRLDASMFPVTTINPDRLDRQLMWLAFPYRWTQAGRRCATALASRRGQNCFLRGLSSSNCRSYPSSPNDRRITAACSAMRSA
jgi:hypothetical protein